MESKSVFFFVAHLQFSSDFRFAVKTSARIASCYIAALGHDVGHPGGFEKKKR